MLNFYITSERLNQLSLSSILSGVLLLGDAHALESISQVHVGLAETRVLLLVVVRMSYLRSVGPRVVHCHLMPVLLQRDLILMDSRLLTVKLLLVLVVVHPVGMLELLRSHDVLAIARAHLSTSLLDALVTLIDHLLTQ